MGFRGTIADLRQVVEARVAGTAHLPFQQDVGTIQLWKRSLKPRAIFDGSSARKHLNYAVHVSDMITTGMGRGSVDDPYEFVATVRVLFLYRIRASGTSAWDDEDGAGEAALAVASSVLTMNDSDLRYNFEPVQIFSPTPSTDGESIMVEQAYSALFHAPLPQNTPGL